MAQKLILLCGSKSAIPFTGWQATLGTKADIWVSSPSWWLNTKKSSQFVAPAVFLKKVLHLIVLFLSHKMGWEKCHPACHPQTLPFSGLGTARPLCSDNPPPCPAARALQGQLLILCWGTQGYQLLSPGHVICMENSSWFTLVRHLWPGQTPRAERAVQLSSALVLSRVRGPWGWETTREHQQCLVSLKDRPTEWQETGLGGTSQVQLIHFVA